MPRWPLAVVALAGATAKDVPEPTCRASGDGACRAADGKAAEQQHHWPHSRGHLGRYGSTQLVGPRNLTAALAWRWHHPKLLIFPGAAIIDSTKHIYASAMDGVRKFSPDGRIIWHYEPPSLMIANPSLMGSRLFGSTWHGHMFAVDIETGKEIWQVQPARDSEMDTPFVEADEGVVLAVFDKRAEPEPPHMSGNSRIVAVNASDGKQLWDYQSSRTLWNFMPMFVGDGSFIIMDIHGGIYRMRVLDGQRVWYTPPPEAYLQSFSDGGVILGPDADVAYTCSNHAFGMPLSTGAIRAYSVKDGTLLWDRNLSEPCLSWPAVGGDGRTVVVPVGPFPLPVPGMLVVLGLSVVLWLPILLLRLLADLLCRCYCKRPRARCVRCLAWTNLCLVLWVFLGCPVGLHQLSIWLGPQQHRIWRGVDRPLQVVALDAKSGAERWRYSDIPGWPFLSARGDEENFWRRVFTWGYSLRPVCGPASWSAPTIDGNGTVYAAAMNGYLYAINDANGDGVIDGSSEVSTLDMGAASLHAGMAFAPGIMVFGSCDGVFAFHT